MNIERIENFFYSRASKRIKQKVEESKLKYAEIYKPDHKQISRIVNNKRNKNNRFLICDAVISNSYKDDATGKMVKCGLLETPELKFQSIKEILWGTNAEIYSYLYELFVLLWEETTTDSRFEIDTELYLCDYIPYAKNRAYWDIIFSRDKYPAPFYGFIEDKVFEEFDSTRDSSLAFLYKRCKVDFFKRFSAFTQKQESFHKLDRIIKDELIKNIFIPVLRKHKPTASSLGLRVRDILYADISHCAPLIVKNNYDYPLSALIKASTDYIQELEKIQNEIV